MSAVLDFPPPADAPTETAAIPATSTAIAVIDPKAAALALLVKTDVPEYSDTERGLIDLHQRLHNIAYSDLTTGKGMDAAIADRKALRDIRVGTAKMAKDLNTKDRTGYETRRDARNTGAEKLIAIAQELETPIDDQISVEVARKEAATVARKAAEKIRVDAHNAKLTVIRSFLGACQGLPSERIAAGIAQLAGQVYGDDWQEFLPMAVAAQAETLESMRALLASTKAAEDAAAAIEAQRLENARVAADQAEAQRKIDEAAAVVARQQREVAASMALMATRQKMIAELKAAATSHESATAADLSQAVADIAAVAITEAIYGDFLAMAQAVRETTVWSLRGLLQAAILKEHNAENERLANDAAEFERGIAAVQHPAADVPATEPPAKPLAEVDIELPAITAQVLQFPAPAVPAPAASEVSAKLPAPVIEIDTINARLAPLLSTDAISLVNLGFKKQCRLGIGAYFFADDFPAICDALIKHIATVKEQF